MSPRHRAPVAILAAMLVSVVAALAIQVGPAPEPRGMPCTGLRSSDDPVATFYVSPDGDDAANGSIAAPFRTIPRAQQAVRALTPATTGDIHVVLRGGRYRLDAGLAFGPLDGTNGTHAVIYKAFANETPVIDGGVALDPAGWEPHAGGIWKHDVSGLPAGTGDFRQLYIVTATGAHHNTPNPASDHSGIPYAGMPRPVSVMTPAHDGTTDWERRAIRASEVVPPDTFTLEGDGHGYLHKSGTWSDLREWRKPDDEPIGDHSPYTTQVGMQDIEFAYHLAWNMPRIKVHHAGITDGQNRIVMQQPAFHLARVKGGTYIGASWASSGQPAWIENAYHLLDEAGEWYHDRHGRMLYYMPLPEEPRPNETTGIEFHVPVVEELLRIEGNATHPVRNLHFQGITFKHASWLRPNDPYQGHVDLQANVLLLQDAQGYKYERSPGAVVVTRAKGIGFERCTFTKLGGAGVDLHLGTRESTVRGCVFDDISGTGINIGGYDMITDINSPNLAVNNSVVNSYFGNIAVEFKGGHAIWAGYVKDTVIEHNTILGTAYTAISVGWGWSPAQTACRNNSISHNHIMNYMMEMKDGGAIYTLSLQNGTRVIGNHIHDGCGSGLYPDEQTWNTTWTRNVVYRSGNSLQDHTLGVYPWNQTSIRENNISGNYFDMLPIIEPRRQDVHLPNNIWIIGNEPAAPVLAVVAGAGIQEAYLDIVPVGRLHRIKTREGLYWSDIVEGEIEKDPAWAWIAVAALAAVTGLGGLTIARPGWTRRGRTPGGGRDG